MTPQILGIIQTIGGLALFLYGVQESTRIFRYNMGNATRDLMARFTRKKRQAFAFGVALSAITQSSTIATSFAVGFVDVGLITFARSVAVMMGASLGGTFVSFLLSLDIVSFAPLLFAFAFFLSKIKRGGVHKFAGVLQGLSLIFMGMLLLKLGTAPLLQNELVREVITAHSASAFTMAGVAFAGAGILQSSPAVIALALALAGAGVLPSSAALPIALGAHVGSTSMVLLAGLYGRQSAKKLGIVTFVYKLAGGAAFVPFVALVHAQMVSLGFSTEGILVFGQILIALFNVILFYPFSDKLAVLVSKFVSTRSNLSSPKYLDDDMLDVPAMSVLLLSKEMIRLANYMEAYLQMLLFPGVRVKNLYAALPKAIEELTDDCKEYMYRIHVPDNDELRARFSTITYTMAIFSDIGSLLRGRLSKWLDDGDAVGLLYKNLGRETWENIARVSLRIFRASLHAFVIHESELIGEISCLEAKFEELSRHARIALGESSFYGRDASQIIRLFSLLQNLVVMSKEVAQGEEFSKC